MKYRKLPVIIEAITFEEFAKYGNSSAVIGIDGMGLAFYYKGHYITMRNDHYLIPTLEGTMKFNRGDMLITRVNGEIYPCKKDIFEKTYEKINEENNG
jgi:hypothetical protein